MVLKAALRNIEPETIIPFMLISAVNQDKDDGEHGNDDDKDHHGSEDARGKGAAGNIGGLLEIAHLTKCQASPRLG